MSRHRVDSVVVAPVDEAEGDEGDEDFAEDADDQRTPALTDEVSQIGAQADTGEGGKEGPAGEIGEAGELAVGEEAGRGEDRDRDEAKDELGELLPEEERLVLDDGGLPSRGPVDGVAEDDEADEGRARGLGEDGEAAGVVAVERAGDEWLRRCCRRRGRPRCRRTAGSCAARGRWRGR